MSFANLFNGIAEGLSTYAALKQAAEDKKFQRTRLGIEDQDRRDRLNLDYQKESRGTATEQHNEERQAQQDKYNQQRDAQEAQAKLLAGTPSRYVQGDNGNWVLLEGATHTDTGVHGQKRAVGGSARSSIVAAAAEQKARLAEIDRYVTSHGGDADKALNAFVQANGGTPQAQTPEEAQQLSGLANDFTASASKYRNRTQSLRVSDGPGGVTTSTLQKGTTTAPTTTAPTTTAPTTTAPTTGTKMTLGQVAQPMLDKWYQESGVPHDNKPESRTALAAWIKANHPEIDVTQ